MKNKYFNLKSSNNLVPKKYYEKIEHHEKERFIRLIDKLKRNQIFADALRISNEDYFEIPYIKNDHSEELEFKIRRIDLNPKKNDSDEFEIPEISPMLLKGIPIQKRQIERRKNNTFVVPIIKKNQQKEDKAAEQVKKSNFVVPIFNHNNDHKDEETNTKNLN